MSCSLNNPLGCVGAAGKAVAGDAFQAIAKDFAKAADWTINWLWSQMQQATAIRLGGRGFAAEAGLMAAVAGVTAVGLLCVQAITSVLRRDPGGIARAVKGCAVAFIGAAAAVAITNELLAATDALSNGVVAVATGGTIDQMGRKVLAAHAISQVGNPAGMFLLSLAAIFASVVVWFALLVRKALIIVSAIFAPLAFAGGIADVTSSWVRRWIEIMLALIVSKLILVMIFVVGVGILQAGIGQTGHSPAQHVTQTATGLVMLSVAGFAPWMALKLVHFGGSHFEQIHGHAGHVSAGVGGAVAVPQKIAAPMRAAARPAGAVGASAGGGSPTPGPRPRPPAAVPAAQPKPPTPQTPRPQPAAPAAVTVAANGDRPMVDVGDELGV